MATKIKHKPVKTHSFRLGKYRINLCSEIIGLCDIPDDGKNQVLDMHILTGNSIKALNSALHEALHAEGVSDKFLHDKEGYEDTDRLARFLWRLGWRNKEGEK